MRMCQIIFICLIPALVMAQDYFEASGSTAVFTLKAGSKAPPIAIKSALIKQKQTVLHIVHSGNTLRVNPCMAGTLRLYSLAGRIVENHAINSSGVITLKQSLKNGVYLIRIESEGVQLKTAKLVVAASRGQK